MNRAAAREIDVLIGHKQINEIFGLDGDKCRACPQLNDLLEPFGIFPVGTDASGFRMWAKSHILAKKDEIEQAIAAEAVGLDYAKLDAILTKAAERQSEQAIAGLRGYMDTVLDDIDERLSKVLNCVQAMVRLQGELKGGVVDMQRTVNAMVASVNSHNTAMKKDLTAELRNLGKSMEGQVVTLAEGVDSINDQFRELIRQVKGA